MQNSSSIFIVINGAFNECKDNVCFSELNDRISDLAWKKRTMWIYTHLCNRCKGKASKQDRDEGRSFLCFYVCIKIHGNQILELTKNCSLCPYLHL